MSSTDLKKKVSYVLHDACYNGVSTIIKKYGKPIAKVIPYTIVKSPKKKKNYMDYFGSIPDFPDVRSLRRSRRTKIDL